MSLGSASPPSPSALADGGAPHEAASRAILALHALLRPASPGDLDAATTTHLANVVCDAARDAAAASGKSLDLIVGRGRVLLGGEALHAPSWVYESAGEVAARLSDAAFCSLFLAESLAADDVLAFVSARSGSGPHAGASARIRVFGLPGHFASLLEAQERAPDDLERLAVVIVGVRRELARARAGEPGSVSLWTSLARSTVELCERRRSWTPFVVSPDALLDRPTLLAVDTAMLAGCMTLVLSSDREVACDSVFATLLLSVMRSRAEPPITWLLGLPDAHRVGPHCASLVVELQALASARGASNRSRDPERSRQGRLIECAWRFVHELEAGDGTSAERMNAAFLAQKARSETVEDHAMLRLLLATVGLIPSGCAVELSNGEIASVAHAVRLSETRVVAVHTPRTGLSVPGQGPGSAREVNLIPDDGGLHVVAVLESVANVSAGSTPPRVAGDAGPGEATGVPLGRTHDLGRRSSTRPAAPPAFTPDELGSFLDEFMVWGK